MIYQSANQFFYLLGWGSNAFTFDNYYFWVPLTMPIVGALLGALVYESLVGIHQDNAGVQEDQEDDNEKKLDFESATSYSLEKVDV